MAKTNCYDGHLRGAPGVRPRPPLRGYPQSSRSGRDRIPGRIGTRASAPLKLAKKTRYEVRIAAGAKDPAGNALAAEALWSFTTGRK